MLKKGKILIVGVNSFLGKCLSRFLIDDYYVFGAYHNSLDEDTTADTLLKIEHLQKLRGDEIHTVYITSAYIPYIKSDEDPGRLWEANIELVQRVCKQFVSSKIVFCSSVSVYDAMRTQEPIDENMLTSTELPYALSKLWGEQIVKMNKQYGIVRFSSIYGVGMTNHTFIPKIINAAITRNKITIFGDGSRCQNYIHVEDAANMLIALGSSPKNGLFLGTGEQSYSNLEIARIVQEFTNCKIEFTGVDNTSSFSYNNGRIKHILGEFYKFQGIKEGLEKIVKWRIEQY